jgi:hypothetical protein
MSKHFPIPNNPATIDSSETHIADNNLRENNLAPKYSKLTIESESNLVSSSDKGNVWKALSKTFKFLHKKGIKRFNSSENESKLVIGSVSISKN